MAEEWVELVSLTSEQEAALVAGYLDSCGVPARVDSHSANPYPVRHGSLADVRVVVAADRRAEAERLLAERDTAPAEPAGDE